MSPIPNGFLTYAGYWVTLGAFAEHGDIMTRFIRDTLSVAGHRIVRGLAVVILVASWMVGSVGTYVATVAGISTVVLTTTTTPADAWRRWGWGRRGWGRRGWWGHRGWWGRRGWWRRW
jgi:hypothetical protein